MASGQNLKYNINSRLIECVTSNKRTAEKLTDVRRCLEQRADVNTVGEDGNTPLHLAVSGERAIIVKLLLKRGADVNARDIYGKTPLHVAVFCREMSIVELLLNKGADLNAKAKNGDAPIHWAIKSGYISVVELLLNKGANLNAQTQSRSSPLHVSAQFGSTSIAELLLSKGADMYMKDIYGSIPLHEAAGSGETSIVELLLNKGIDVCVQDGLKYTPLHMAARSREISVVVLLLNKGADVNAQAVNGYTPLHEAAQSGDISVVELLLNKGAKVNPRAATGDIPLHRALHSGETSVVKLLINNGADVNAQTMHGEAPLHRASSCGDISVVELLLNKGATVNAPDKKGNTPLHMAAHSGNLSIVKLLLTKGATVNAPNKAGNTPLHMVASENVSVIKLLINKGADVNAQTLKGDTSLHLVVAGLGLNSIVKQALDKINVMNAQATPLFDAAFSGMSVIKLLLNKGTKVNVQTTDGYTPLHLAGQYGLTSLVELLLNKGADANAQTTEGYTPLHLVAKYGQTSIVELLHNKDANVNLQDKVGNTPLHEAVQNQKTSIVKELLSKDADANLRNDQGKTPLFLAAEIGLTLIVGQLSKVTDVTGQVTNGDTPLHGAARFGRTSTAKLLLYKGADINARNAIGETPLHVAVRHEYVALATLLVRRGANVTLRKKTGETPLDYARLFSVNEKIEILLQTAEKEASDNTNRLNYYRSQDLHDVFLCNKQDVLLNNSLQTKENKYLKTTETSGLLGQLYETKLVSLIFVRVLNQDLIEHDILLGVNIDGIGAMDDICLRYRVKGRQRPVLLFMQVKHREGKKKLTNETLCRDSGDFCLLKYFESYLTIKERFRVGNEDPMFEGEFSDVDCYFILYTTAKENISEKRTTSIVSDIMHDLINTEENAEPFQYDYNGGDIDRIAEDFAGRLKNLEANSLTNLNLIEYYKEQAKRFFSNLWFYPCQAKQDEIERIVKNEINQHYNNKKDANKLMFTLHSNAIFLKVHHDIQKWWKLDNKARYLNRSNDFFILAKQSCLDNVLLTFYNAMEHLKISVDFEFKQRFDQSHFSFETPIIFNTIFDRLCKIFDTKNKLITVDIEFKNEIVNLLITDKKLLDRNYVPSSDQIHNLNIFLKHEQNATSNKYFKNNEQSEYSKRVGTSEVGGVMFKTKMLNLVHLRALNHEQIEQDFLLGNQFLGISVLSDICLRYRVKEQLRPVVLFVQLIHREHPEKGILTDDSLWSDSKDFSLLKYFNSYVMIKELFRAKDEDPVFKEEFNDVDCYFVLYTSVKENIIKKKTQNKLSFVVHDLISTGQNAESFQYDHDEADINRLTKSVAMDEIVKLGTDFLECMMREKYNPNVLGNKLIARYHVAMRREVLQPCAIQPENKEYRTWEFRSEFFNSGLDYLVTLKKTLFKIISSKCCDQNNVINECQQIVTNVDVQEKLESLKLKLPIGFGNLDMTFRGHEAKVLKRIKVLADKLIYLLELNKDTKIVEINDDDVGPGKTIEQGIININGGIGSAVGNLFVLDVDSNLLKFDLENEALPHNAALLLGELKDDRHKSINKDLSSFRFKINIEYFPKYNLTADEYDKAQVKEFLNKFWFYPDQAKEDEVERIFKHEIYSKYSDYKICSNYNSCRNNFDLISLHCLDEMQKLWLQTSESPYLSRASELFERAELADIYNLLQTVINYMYISDIYSMAIKIKRANKHEESKQIHDLFKKIVVKLFHLCGLQFNETFEFRRSDYEITEESMLSLKIDPEMEWVALTVTSVKTSKFENAHYKRCFVAKAATGRRRKDGFMLYEQYLCGRIYRFKDCFTDTNIEFFIR